MTILLWPLVVLLLAVPEMSLQGDATCRPQPRPFLKDTNMYVCPPSASGGVRYHSLEGYTKGAGVIFYGTYDTRYIQRHGYASFDLSEVPDSIDVMWAQLWYYQYESGPNMGGQYPPRIDLTLVPDVNVPAQQLFESIRDGQAVDTTIDTYNGWVVRPFNTQGVAAVDSCRVRGESIDFGVRGGSCAWGDAYGVGPYHPLRAFLKIGYSSVVSYRDIVALDAGFDSFPLVVGDSIVVTGRFTNTGNSSALGATVRASCTGTADDSIIIGSLAPGETANVRVALRPASEPGIASLVLCSNVQGDWCRHNDTTIASAYVFPHGTRSAEDFEPEHSPSFPPSGWVVSNGGDTNTWYRAGPGDRYAHTGGYYATSVGNEDWLITSGLAPTIGIADTMGFFVSASGGLQAWALASQDPYNTLGLLLDTAFAPGWLGVHVSLDQYDGREVYLGFRTYAHGRACLDDVWFTSERVPAVTEQTRGVTSSLRLILGQSPVTGDEIMLQYEAPEPGLLLVEVTDACGRKITHQRLPAAPASGRFDFASTSWPSGAYFVRVTSGATTVTKKLLLCRRRP